MGRSKLISSIAILSVFLACGGEEIQPGERFTLSGERVGAPGGVETAPMRLALGNASARDWPAHLSNDSNLQPNAAFSANPSLVAAIDLGVSGVRRPVYGASAPIIVGERIYHYDAAGFLQAFTLGGQRIWRASMIPQGKSAGDGYGGGLSYENGIIYVATGFGEISAVRAQSGETLWSYKHNGALRRPPLVHDNRVIALTSGQQSVALDARAGAEVWRHFSKRAISPQRFNAGVPALSERSAVLGYSTGEVALTNLLDGSVIWSIGSISDAFGGSKSLLGDVTGDPVVAGGRIYMGTASGVLAIDARSGNPIWSNGTGTKGSLLVSGNGVFALTPNKELILINAASGKTAYRVQLPERAGEGGFGSQRLEYLDLRMINGVLVAFDQRGGMHRYRASDGALLGVSTLPARFAASPVFGKGVMVGISQSGQLLIYR